jgi:hypothetical protein
MTITSFRRRLEQLENQRRFLNWFARDRLFNTLTSDELSTFAMGGDLPESTLNRPNTLEHFDRASLIKRWEEEERLLGWRSKEELAYYAQNGVWPEHGGRLHYSLEEGRLIVEWRHECED